MDKITEFQGKYRFLSNFYVSSQPISVANLEFMSAEHLYQALKTLSATEAAVVMICKTPGAAKRAGQMVTVRDDWENVKLKAMVSTVSRKFLFDPPLLRALIGTGNARLVEGNTWHDNFWGNCACTDCAEIAGENHLGKVLMHVRDYAADLTSLDF